MRSFILFAALAAAAGHAQTPSPQTPAPPTPAPQLSIQGQFDAAAEMLRREKWPEALEVLDVLEARLAGGTNRRSLAIVRLRRAEALARIDRFDEAEAAIAGNLPLLAATDETLAEDRLRAMLTYGLIAELRLDYDEAVRRYSSALEAPGPAVLRLLILRGLIQTEMFGAPQPALAHVEQAAALARDIQDNRRLLGQISAWRGRVLLNQRRLPEAREALTEAIRQLGGMSNMVDASDVVARSDMAIVMLLLGDQDRARRFLAFTGAGRYRRGYLQPFDAQPPRCDGEVGPQDVAVIEFAVGADGRVRSAAPIYATRWSAGRAFARAVARWRFNATALDQIPSVFLNLSRVELRCSLAGPSGPQPGGACAKLGRHRSV